MNETKQPTLAETECSHDWKVYRETITPDNPDFDGSGAYFIVKGCSKCKHKKRLDYFVEGVK